MRVSLRWLRDYVDIDIEPKDLADRLTMAGLEVDSVEPFRPSFEGVVTAKILSVKPHPQSEKLHLCEVTTGDAVLPIVCGAPNVRAGQVVPLAKVGAVIPGGFAVKSSRIRGELSEGMLCSEDELGIGEDNTGILVLPDHLPLGQDLVEALGLGDTVFDIGVTPNRSDCLSIIGIAREIAALTGGRLRYPQIQFAESSEDIRGATSVQILDPDLCPRYSARMIRKVKIKPSPRWMRLRLEAVGLRSINNVVDITNFVMMELGQPLHAFDFRFLEKGRIVVRRSKEGEPFVSLDGKTRTLNAETPMICDGVKPVAIAGIMGGENSEVKDDTETVLLESAYFNPTTIRRGGKWLGMSTDAAFRFERGIDPEGVIRALNRAAQLMAELAGGVVLKGHIDEYPRKVETAKNIPLRKDRITEVLGIRPTPTEIRRILRGLEMTVEKGKGGYFEVTPPTFRVDLLREIDLIEEIARVRGYDAIPTTLPAIPAPEKIEDARRSFEDGVRTVLTGYGYQEVINYSFTTPASADVLGLAEGDDRRKFVRIANPLTEEQSVMRTSLLYGLLDTVRRNVRAGCHDLKIFELGKIFIHRKEGELPLEEERIGGLITGARYDRLWHFKDLEADFYDLKGCVENLLEALKIRDAEFLPRMDLPYLHPGRSCGIQVRGRDAGCLGEIHPDVLGRLDLPRRVTVFDLSVDVLLGTYSRKVSYREFSRFPAITRDVALLIRKDLDARRILEILRENHEELLENVDIFDVYSGKGIPEDVKSLGLRMTYRSAVRTLTDEEISPIHSRIIGNLVQATEARIRGEGS
jgi:phenylalanyl-tRNA synthetase beta chain